MKYREFYEADRAVSAILDEASPGLNTPRPQDHYDRLGVAIERRMSAVKIIEEENMCITCGDYKGRNEKFCSYECGASGGKS